MTREEQIQQEAINYALRQDDDFVYGESEAFIAGAKWADKTMIEKACEFLKTANAAQAIVIRKGVYNMREFSVIEFTENFVEQFKKDLGL